MQVNQNSAKYLIWIALPLIIIFVGAGYYLLTRPQEEKNKPDEIELIIEQPIANTSSSTLSDNSSDFFARSEQQSTNNLFEDSSSSPLTSSSGADQLLGLEVDFIEDDTSTPSKSLDSLEITLPKESPFSEGSTRTIAEDEYDNFFSQQEKTSSTPAAQNEDKEEKEDLFIDFSEKTFTENFDKTEKEDNKTQEIFLPPPPVSDYTSYEKKEEFAINPEASTITKERTISTTTVQMPKMYTVVAGDTLSKIASKQLGSVKYADNIFLSNTDILASPDELQIGMKLKIPELIVTNKKATDVTIPLTTANDKNLPLEKGWKKHIVRPGDNLSSLAVNYYGASSAWDIIYQANKKTLKNPNSLRVGEELLIPPYGSGNK